MNWRASLTGAVIVLAGGIATGALIGGSATTKTRTVTVVRPEAPPQGDTSTGGAGTTPTGTAPQPPTASRQPLASIAGPQLSNIDDAEVSSRGSAEINGHTFGDSLVIDSMFTDCTTDKPSGRAFIGFSVQAGLGRFTGTLGLNSTDEKTDRSFAATVSAHSGSESGPELAKPRTFTGSSAYQRVSFPLNGARRVVFRFDSPVEKACNGDPSIQGSTFKKDSEFVFADAAFVP